MQSGKHATKRLKNGYARLFHLRNSRAGVNFPFIWFFSAQSAQPNPAEPHNYKAQRKRFGVHVGRAVRRPLHPKRAAVRCAAPLGELIYKYKLG